MPQLIEIFRQRLGEQVDQFQLPLSSFTSMQGEILSFDLEAGSLEARFPILESQLNPYGTMQGGFLAAAVDNTLGPLSFLVAPPNVTRRLEMTYSRPVMPDLGHVIVRARLERRDGRQFQLRADVLDQQGNRLARAVATHWVLDPAAGGG